MRFTASLAPTHRADIGISCSLRNLWVPGLPRGLFSLLPSLFLALLGSAHLADQWNVRSGMQSSGPSLCLAKGH